MRFAVQNRRLDCFTRPLRSNRKRLSPRNRNYNLRVRWSVHHIEILAGDREKSHLDKHVKRTHRTGIVVAGEIFVPEHLCNLTRPFCNKIASTDIREQPWHHETRFISEIHDSVIKRILNASAKRFPASAPSDQTRHVVRDEKRIFPRICLVEIRIEPLARQSRAKRAVRASCPRESANAACRVHSQCIPHVRPVPGTCAEPRSKRRFAYSVEDFCATPVLIRETHRRRARLETPAVVFSAAIDGKATFAVVASTSAPPAF